MSLDRLQRRMQRSMIQDAPALPAVPRGSSELLIRKFDVGYRHGTTALSLAQAACPKELAKLALDTNIARADIHRALFLDTETTGLAGGTGTLPFLLGLGYFEGERFVVEQHFLPEPGLEAPLLSHLHHRVQNASMLVTYNGKSYDWPLLQSRCVLNRMRLPNHLPHLDLLHCSRRMLKRRLGSVRLVDVEQALLGFVRHDDVDGGQIPELYFKYLKMRDVSLLSGVFEHNVQDILALAAILGQLARSFANPKDPAMDARDCLSLAHVAARAGDSQRALSFAEATARQGEPDVAIQSAILQATLTQRRREFTRAREVLEAALPLASSHSEKSHVHLMLAKIYEHRLKQLPSALEHAKHTASCEGDFKHERRLARLRAKIRLSSAR